MSQVIKANMTNEEIADKLDKSQDYFDFHLRRIDGLLESLEEDISDLKIGQLRMEESFFTLESQAKSLCWFLFGCAFSVLVFACLVLWMIVR